MGTTAFFVVWLPLGVTFLVAGLVALRQGRSVGCTEDSISFERRPSSAVTTDRVLPPVPFGNADSGDGDAREYRLLGMAMLAGGGVSILVGTVQLL